MYYGVFTKDLKSIKCGEITLGEARRWLSKGYVICTEKEITTGLEIKIQFHKRPRWHWCKWDTKKDIGFVSFEFRKLKYYWADKVVEEYNESEVTK